LKCPLFDINYWLLKAIYQIEIFKLELIKMTGLITMTTKELKRVEILSLVQDKRLTQVKDQNDLESVQGILGAYLMITLKMAQNL
tara:strand:- start:2408 stop:2662 length:255 start_codon:yes stop_codon:yes gene_type:complete